MSKHQEQMEKMVALVLIAYAIGLLLGEAVRDRMYGDGRDEAGGQDQSLGKKGGLAVGGGRDGSCIRGYSCY